MNNDSYGNQREAVLLAYMAGIMDGEGTFGITKTKPNRYANIRYSARVGLGMAEKEVLELFQNRYGGSLLTERVQKDRKPIYRWYKVGDSENTIKVIEDLLPYLIAKKKQAEMVLEYIKGKQTTGFQRNQGVPESELQRREHYYQMLRELNAVGAPATTNRDDTGDGEVIV